MLGAICSGLLIATSTAQFTTPMWPPFTDGGFDFTTPPWPPVTETDEVVTQPGDTTLIPPVTTTTTPAPGGNNNNDQGDDSAWMVTAIVFIVLAVAFAVLAIYLYVSLPKRTLRPGRTFVLPRVNP